MAQDSTAARRAVGVISLGCPKNLVDTEVMLGRLQAAGFQIVADPTRADVLLVNTCCFIAPAREEAAEALAEAAEWRRGEAGRILICAGCWPEMDAAHLRERFPEIDALMGPGDVADVVSIVERACKGEGAQAPASPPAHYLHDEGNPRLLSTPPWTAYVKIAEGCSHRCAFCTIPSLRGPYRSRSPDAVLLEARNLVARGVKELNLVAQDTTAYAADEGQTDIADLLARLGDLEGLTWVRLLYAHPTTVSDRLIEVMASHDRVCDYLDVPFQHSAGSVLRKMGRPGDGDAFLRLIARLRQAMPDVAIRSTFLLGFPGETDEEFQDLLDFIEAAQLDRAGAFCYSRERGTRAAELPNQVPTETAQARFHEFMVRQQSISLARNERWVGRDLEVLVETQGERPGQWLGRSFRDAPEIDGTVQIIAERRALSLGQFARVRVTGAEPYDLMGELPSPRSARRRTTRPAG
ncbi:MAG: 30S ribosomal protein S12 methylthiotransferase RimO [Armatimonadetes bacterium]|nr:30S ribosomal protein S12 methylthiotransferase RimO [Armatimonadota bacterium]